jgi:hypothetical protein
MFEMRNAMSGGGLSGRIVCLYSLSKNLEGELRLLESEQERCRERECTTLETLHHVVLRATRHDCDSDIGALLDGTLHSGDLVHKFEGGDGNRRGIHEGSFRWKGAGVLAEGTLRGVTNAGTHRRPAFDDCQRCDNPGVMEGLLLGTIRRARDRRLLGCGLQAAYRLRFDPSSQGGSGAVSGTLEGAIVCDCRREPTCTTCIDFSAMQPGAGPNPRTEQGVSFIVHDAAGNPLPNTQISPLAGFTGLDTANRTDIKLPFPCTAVEATLVTGARPAVLEAFNSDGTQAGVATMTGAQNVAETLRVTGTSIDSAVITAPQNETRLLRFCFEWTPRYL